MTSPKNFSLQTLADMVGEENISIMLENYLEAGYPWLEEFKSEWHSAGDVQQIHLLAHKMKSSLRFIGATDLADQLEFIEKHTHEKMAETWGWDQDIYDSVVDEYTELLSEIELFLQ